MKTNSQSEAHDSSKVKDIRPTSIGLPPISRPRNPPTFKKNCIYGKYLATKNLFLNCKNIHQYLKKYIIQKESYTINIP